jgi:hypothetical protein
MKILFKYIINILIAIDQFINTIFFGDPDETISSRTGKAIRANKGSWFAKKLNAFLDLFEKNHSINSIEEEEGKDAIIKN